MGAVQTIKEKLGHLVEIIKPEPDSQYKLVPCSCGSSEVVHICFGYYAYYAVVCDTCGKQTAMHRNRHKVQMEWNGGKPPSWERD